MSPEELRPILAMAEGECRSGTPSPYARAIVELLDALHHYEKLITWDTGCQSCAALFDKLLDADRRAQLAEAALCVASVMTQRALEQGLKE